MSCALATGSRNRAARRNPGRSGALTLGVGRSGTVRPARGLRNAWLGLAWSTLAAAVLICVALLGGCATAVKKSGPDKTVLVTKQGESSIQVVESEVDGNQVVRINTRYRGEDHSIVLQIDQPVYDVEIPLTLEQIAPQTTAAARSGPEGQFQDLLIAQYFDKAQQAMMAGDYPGALREVNLVLLTRPDHVQAHAMKGSIYYAMGSYDLANEEYQRVLQLDPSNQEVRAFVEFLKNRKGAPQPPLPAAPGAGAGGAAVRPGGAPPAAAPAWPPARTP